VFEKKTKKNFFDEIASPQSLVELGIDRARILRSIESLKANSFEVNPSNIALDLGIPRAFIYADLDILEMIYRNSDSALGHDKVIQTLIAEIKALKRKNEKLLKRQDQIKKDAEKSFNDGFAKGAAMSFSKASPGISEASKIDEKELWARGVLGLSLTKEITESDLRKSYRLLISVLHPDQSGKDTGSLLQNIKEAYDYFLE
jgi:hypothetical protein